VKGKKVKVQVPNLRNASVEQKADLIAVVEGELSQIYDWVIVKANGMRMDVNELTQHLSSMVYAAAQNTLGMTGERQWRQKSVDRLDKKRHSLSSLLRFAQQIHICTHLSFDSQQWNRKYEKCNRMLMRHLSHPIVDHSFFFKFVLYCRRLPTLLCSPKTR
jgi:hypothetical protein